MYNYKNNSLMCENINIEDLTRIYQTPFYLYSKNSILEKINTLKNAFSDIDNTLFAYAIKAESNLSILKIMIEQGIGADVVSIWEAKKYVYAGGDPKKIVFSSVAKSDYEITEALKIGIKTFNIESIPEAKRIDSIAQKLDVTAYCSIRVNPDIYANTHEKITTGTHDDKFGISAKTIKENLKTLMDLDYVKIETVDMHIGSQILEAEPFYEAITVLIDIIKEMKSFGFEIKNIDIGGGYGVRYDKNLNGFDFENFKKNSIPLLKNLGLNVITEPGRYYVAEAGALITKVEYIKKEYGRTYVVVDAGMNDYIRVAMYEAYNEIIPIKKMDKTITASIVGPICESSDIFAEDIEFYDVKEGDIIAILDTGAYGFSMSSNYNARPLLSQVLVDNSTHRLIRKRQSFEDMIKDEVNI